MSRRSHLWSCGLLCVLAVPFLFPTWWMITSSVKLVNEIFSFPPSLIPTSVSFDAYRQAFTLEPFAHQYPNWPALAEVDVRFRGQFAYVDGYLTDGTMLPLCRLRYGGYANQWGFAIWLASKDGYEDSYLPNGSPGGSAEDALDCACGLYLNDPTVWQPH